MKPIIFAVIAVAQIAVLDAHAQAKFPTRPVRIVTVGAASQNDILARLIAPKLSEQWGQPVVNENRTGAGGAMAANTVAKATPDGYTVLMLSNQFAIGAAVHANLPYDPIKDFAGGSTPEEFDKMIRSGIDTFIRMAKLAGLRAK